MSHLVVLVHGLHGTSKDLSYLARKLERESKDVIVLCSRRNEGRQKTIEGVAAGGARLVNEIKDFVSTCPGLTSISFVGNSLGGIFSRYAIGMLDDIFQTLTPRVFLTIVSPHLGVKRFTFLHIPQSCHTLSPLIFGQTGRDLSLLDGSESIMMKLTDLESSFMKNLSKFRLRVALANETGDFMVPLQTAAFFSSNLTHSRVQEPSHSRFVTSVISHKPTPAPAFSNRMLLEDVMAARLNTLPWLKVVVTFPYTTNWFLPLSHNRICALSRNCVLEWLFRDGQEVMDFAAELVISDDERRAAL